MHSETPEAVAVIAGKGAYPRLLADSAHAQGVRRVFAVAFKGETARDIERAADEVRWVRLGRLGDLIDALRSSGIPRAVMAGQITPTHLFRIRPDRRMLSLLKRLPARNAETIFGAVGEELAAAGIQLMPASRFMEAHMPAAGLLSRRAPTEGERDDIRLGLRAAKATSALDIGQTVVVKEGTLLAVEAFEGTNETIRRAARLGGPGIVVVKVAKPGHDMRFDIPVIGVHTLALLKKVRAAALALEAGRAIVLEQERVVERADKMNLCLTVMKEE